MKNEMKGSCPIYLKDLGIVKDFKKEKKLKTLADSLRVIIEYANSHGALA